MKVQIRNMDGEDGIVLEVMGPKEMMAALGALITGQAMIIDTSGENEIRVRTIKEPTNLAGTQPPDLSEEEIKAMYGVQEGGPSEVRPFTGTMNATVKVVKGVITEVNDRPVDGAVLTSECFGTFIASTHSRASAQKESE